MGFQNTHDREKIEKIQMRLLYKILEMEWFYWNPKRNMNNLPEMYKLIKIQSLLGSN